MTLLANLNVSPGGTCISEIKLRLRGPETRDEDLDDVSSMPNMPSVNV